MHTHFISCSSHWNPHIQWPASRIDEHRTKIESEKETDTKMAIFNWNAANLFGFCYRAAICCSEFLFTNIGISVCAQTRHSRKKKKKRQRNELRKWLFRLLQARGKNVWVAPQKQFATYWNATTIRKRHGMCAVMKRLHNTQRERDLDLWFFDSFFNPTEVKNWRISHQKCIFSDFAEYFGWMTQTPSNFQFDGQIVN